MRVVVADDSVLFREGLVRLLDEAGHDVVVAVADADSLVAAVGVHRPDLAVVDVRMPPTMTDDGVRAAHRVREIMPQLPIMLLSQHVEIRGTVDLVTHGAFGYLLKDRVLQVDDFLGALNRVATGGSALDPAVVGALIRGQRPDEHLGVLSTREREVLGLWRPKASPTPPSRPSSSSPSGPSRPTCVRSSASCTWWTAVTPTVECSPSWLI